MIDPAELEAKIAQLLDDFYGRRIQKISGLDLKKTLLRKNPYLYRALGVQKASDIIEGLLVAYMSSSDEGIFGDAFFEPLANFVSGGNVAPSPGVDVAMESSASYMAIAVKSGPNVFNAQSKKRQEEEFNALRKRMQKLQKHFDPIVGYCYGRKRQAKSNTAPYRELAGQAFWEELTGDPDFYLTIIRLMKDKPQEHAQQYTEEFNKAMNRFTKEFTSDFCTEDGSIDWEALVRFNSGKS